MIEYEYFDEHGGLLFVVERRPGKRFICKRPDGNGGWLWNLNDTRRVPYRLPQLIEASGPVYIVEGEKDVHALEAWGLVATCNPGGAGKGKWNPEWASYLPKPVFVFADNDDPGRAHAREVAESSPGARVVELPGLDEGGDVSDWIAAGGTKEELERICALSPSEPTATVQPPPEDASSLSLPRTTATVQPPPCKPPPLASDLRILDRFKADLRLHGVVGEERNGATLYLGITSRLLPKPVSLVVKGDSSSGKSFTTEQTVRFFPPEAIIAMTAMSEKALVYMKEEFSHRTLIIYEAAALKENAAAQGDNQTSYFVRSLISEGRLDYPVTVRDKDGGFTTKRIVKEGPTGLIITTTATRLHGENETRLLSLPTDDSREQTKRVLLRISDDVDPKGGPELTEWHQLQAWLQTEGECRVVIPFASRLADLIPPVAVRLRRDFSSILNLIKAHAILHQLNRERDAEGRVVASVEDYAVVRDLVADLVSDGVEATVSEATREAVECVERLAAATPGGVQVVAIARELNLDKSAALRRVRAGRERGYLENMEERRGRPGRYVIAEPLPEKIELLPQPEALLQPRNPTEDKTAGQAGGCTVAGVSEGKREPEEPKFEMLPARSSCSKCEAEIMMAPSDGSGRCAKCIAEDVDTSPSDTEAVIDDA